VQIHRHCLRFGTLCLALAGVFALGTTRPTLADVYKYVDASGKIYFTDVPLSGAKFTLEWQRASAKLIDENKKKLLASGRVEAPSKTATKRRSEHARLIDATARQYGLVPELLHAVIRTESAYNQGAVSSAGAIGLMQLMPGTAARYKVGDIWEPAANVRGGAAYLRDLLDMFDQDLRLALAGYNAGEGAVIKYGRQIPPYPETQQYVRKVLQFLWDEQRSVPARRAQPSALVTAPRIQASTLTKIAKAP
jgi:soluble lytic murein transglycosylase-like protein